MGEAIVGVLVIVAAVLFAFPKTRPGWWRTWRRLRYLIAVAAVAVTLAELAAHTRPT